MNDVTEQYVEELNDNREKIRELLRTTDKHVMSAEEIGDALDISRQWVHELLTSGVGGVERVELGPSVGYYYNRDFYEQLDREFENTGTLRPTGVGAMELPCHECNELIGEGERCYAILESVRQSKPDWDCVEAVCTDHDVEIDDLCSQTLGQEYVDAHLNDHGGTLVVVEAELSEAGREYDGRDEQLYSYELTNVQVVRLYRTCRRE